MRWFIEVSRVGEDAIDEKLCVEARRWQEALQRVREYRGDVAPLSSFSIELLDNGYRAVNVMHKRRYLVERAPSDAPLSTEVPESPVRPSSRAPGATSSPPSGAASRAAAVERPSALPASRELGLPAGGLVRFQEIQRRFEEPTPEAPISYREVAYGVNPGTSREAIEQLLFDRLGGLRSELDGRRGCFVQLAVFDHVWVRRPLRPPLATLVWKDWRGEPELAFPGSKPAAPAPDGESMEPIAPSPVIAATSSAPPETTHETPEGVADAASAAEEQSASSTPPERDEESTPASTPGRQSPAAPRLVLAEPDAESSPSVRRRRSETDLIGELFETLHDLHFCPDVVSGADLVLKVLKQTLPSRLCFVHVFDINARNFVLVRQAGADVSLLLTRTPDKDPLVDQVMHAHAAVKVDDAGNDERFRDGRWVVEGTSPRFVLCCAARQGGRYLGLVELADPVGGAPFSEVDTNALEYLCGQLGEFIANRPLVLDDDVVLANR
jgi:hypothetical protein